jgi:hypothetical protein
MTDPGVPSAEPVADRHRFVSPTRSTQWAVFAAGTIVILFVWLGPATRNVHWVNGDLLTYRQTLDLMRHGAGYYDAAVTALQDHSEVRFLRTPIMFWFWERTGLFTWPATLAVIVAVGILVGILSWPLAGLGIELWLVGVNHPFGSEQWGYNEVWALPFVLLAMLGVRRERWWLAAMSALVAALVRETAVLVLVGGAIGAICFKRPLVPWITACLAWAVFIVWHLTQVFPRLEPSPTGPASAGSVFHVLDMFGVWLVPLSAVIVVYALWRTRFTLEWLLVAPVSIAIPLAGFWLYRPYWSYLVLPPAVALLGFPSSAVRAWRLGSRSPTSPVT